MLPFPQPAAAPADGVLLAGQAALVSGAGRGIGAATARLLARAGAHVGLIDVDTGASLAVVAEIEAAGGRAYFLRCDVTDPAAVRAAVDAFAEAEGRLDVLINNAGITADKTALKLEPEAWRRVLDVNLSGAFWLAQAAAAPMRRRGYGRVVNTASTSAWGKLGQANYAASKAGIIGLTRSLAIEWARYGITVNAVAPGFIDTEMTAAMPETARRASIDATPIGRVGTPDDVARAHLFFASPASGFITGQILRVDGGLKLVR